MAAKKQVSRECKQKWCVVSVTKSGVFRRWPTVHGPFDSQEMASKYAMNIAQYDGEEVEVFDMAITRPWLLDG